MLLINVFSFVAKIITKEASQVVDILTKFYKKLVDMVMGSSEMVVVGNPSASRVEPFSAPKEKKRKRKRKRKDIATTTRSPGSTPQRPAPSSPIDLETH